MNIESVSRSDVTAEVYHPRKPLFWDGDYDDGSMLVPSARMNPSGKIVEPPAPAPLQEVLISRKGGPRWYLGTFEVSDSDNPLGAEAYTSLAAKVCPQ